MLSCTKEIREDLNSFKKLSTRSYTATSYTDILDGYGQISNGIMFFSSYSDLNDYLELIRSLDADSTRRVAAYSSLGYNLDSIGLYFTPNPVLEKIETDLSFASAREAEESDFVSHLQNNESIVDFMDHFVYDPCLKSALNSLNEIKIGSIYFRLIDENRTVIVGNSNYTQFTNSRTCDLTSVIDDYNIRLFDLTKSPLSDVFVLSEEDSSRASLNKIIKPKFSYSMVSEDSFTFRNTSFVDVGNSQAPTYSWIFSNGYTYNGFQPSPIHFQSNDFPLSLTLRITDSNSNTYNYSQQVQQLICEMEFPYCQDGATMQIDLIHSPLASLIQSGCTVYWNWGDQTGGQGSVITHTFNTGAPYYNHPRLVTGEIWCNGGRVCNLFAYFTPAFKCNLQGKVEMEYTNTQSPAGKYKMYGIIWADQNIMNSSIGTKTSGFIKTANGKYAPFITPLYQYIEGYYWRSSANCCIKVIQNKTEVSGVNSTQTWLSPTAFPRFEPDKLWSDRRMTIGNIVIQPADKLYLR